MNKFRLPTGPAQFKPPPAAKEATDKFMRKGKTPKPANPSGVQIPRTTKGPTL